MSRTQTVAAIDVAHHTDYLQADITIDSETMISGDTADDRVRVQLQGFYYNNTFENPDDIKENDSTGELGVQLEIQKKRSDGTLQAIGYMYRCPDAVCSAVPNPFWEVLDCDVQYDTPVTVALERNDRRFTWTCNGASTTYDYPENLKLYDSIPWKIRRIRARAYTSGAPGAKTYLKAYVDNVYTVKKKRSLLLSLIPILAAQKK